MALSRVLRNIRRGGYVPHWDDYVFFILDRITLAKFKDLPKASRNGHWILHRGTLYVSCPKCACLERLGSFFVHPSGKVDTEDCINCNGCKAHYFAILDEWTSDCAKKRTH